MSRIYAQQKRPGAKAAEPSYSAPAIHAPSMVSGASSSDLDAMMQAKFQQHFLDNQIPTAEAEADRIAASVSGARTPEEVKSQLGEKMGADFSGVTFHTDPAALKQADAMGARAYTTGSDVYFGQGGFDPGVAAHELVHTVQQGMVGSAMQTTSAPTGGVQMKPSPSKEERRLQKSARRRQKYLARAKKKEQKKDKKLQKKDPIAWRDKQDLYKAHVILQSMHNANPIARSTERQQTEEMLETGKNTIKGASWFKRRFGKFNSIYNQEQISFKKYERELARLDRSLASYDDGEISLDNVDLIGLNPKKMLDIATHMGTVAKDFHGLDIGDVRASTPPKDTVGIMTEEEMEAELKKIPKDVAMDTDQGPKNIRINTSIFGPDSKGIEYPNNDENYAAAGIDETGQAFIGVHELGHVVNYHLQDRINEDRQREGKKLLTSDVIARGFLADALTAEAGEDQKLRSLLHTHAGLQEDADLSDQSIKQAIADALTPIQGKTQNDPSSPSALMNALKDNGYTSIYGGSDPSEMYAEAFAAHYRNEYEKNSDSPNQDVLNKKLNPLSSRIVNQSKDLFHDKDKLKNFADRYFHR